MKTLVDPQISQMSADFTDLAFIRGYLRNLRTDLSVPQ